MSKSDRFFLCLCFTAVVLFAVGSVIHRQPVEEVQGPPVAYGADSDHPIVEGPRSPQWPAVRAAHLKTHPCCEVCGTMAFVEVHHIKAFHTNPELELDKRNLVTLCRGERNHHFRFGHDPDGIDGPRGANWSESNPDVMGDIKKWHRRNGAFD